MSFLGSGLAGGLGAGIGTALGAKLAAPKREVIACVGDGSYMFGNPVPHHFVSRAENLPTLTVVANNHQWLAVRMSTLAVYPDGAASKANVMPVQDLNPSPDFEKVVESCGGYGEKVEGPDDLDARAQAHARQGALRHAGAAERVDADRPLTAAYRGRARTRPLFCNKRHEPPEEQR